MFYQVGYFDHLVWCAQGEDVEKEYEQ